MKRKLFIIINLLFILCFTGCTYGSEFTVGSVESNTLTSMSMEYLKFSGNKNTKIKLEEAETCEIYVNIVSEDGKLDLFITDENGEHSYEGHNIPTSEFTVTLSKAGQYKIRVEAKDHKGSYKINWDIKK